VQTGFELPNLDGIEMSYELIIFTAPPNASAILMHDSGLKLVGHPTVHPTGRIGIGFDIPNTTPNGHGASLFIGMKGKISIEQRGILWLNDGLILFPWTTDQTAVFNTDDFILQDEIVCPEIPVPPIPPNPPIELSPIAIINAIYRTGNYELDTKESCGKFTEACCVALHDFNSSNWGHIKKFVPQNQYNGHAVDALMLLVRYKETIAGIYDIIKDSESSDAEPAFNFKGIPEPGLWYYPA